MKFTWTGAIALVGLSASDVPVAHSFAPHSPGASVTSPHRSTLSKFGLGMSSFAADGSEYSSKDSDYDEDDLQNAGNFRGKDPDDDDDAPVQELKPVPMSKNTGNRFVALLWDQELDTKGRDTMELHIDRNELVEDHVMFCRKRNLYNETFNTDSMVDILRSLPM